MKLLGYEIKKVENKKPREWVTPLSAAHVLNYLYDNEEYTLFWEVVFMIFPELSDIRCMVSYRSAVKFLIKEIL